MNRFNDRKGHDFTGRPNVNQDYLKAVLDEMKNSPELADLSEADKKKVIDAVGESVVAIDYVYIPFNSESKEQ